MATVEEKVDRLEQALQGFITSVGMEFNKAYNLHMRLEMELKEFKDEMRAFKDEMRVFKDEMGAFKDEMRVFKDEMGAFKDEMGAFKDEMRVFKDEMGAFKDEMLSFKDEMRQQTREMNQKWGEMANKLGTLVEDLVAPSLPRIVKEQCGLDITDMMVRRKKKLGDGRTREFDAIAVARDYVFLNYTVSTLRPRDVDTFPSEIAALREFLPEYAGLKVVGILASLYIDPGVIAYAEKAGFMVLAVGDQLMEVKNSPGFKPKEW